MSFRSTIACLLAATLLTGCGDRQDSAKEQPANAALAGTNASASEKVIVDQIGALDRSHKGEAPPAATFTGPEGAMTSIAAFKGKPVLVNLWATWCGPCVKEMPTLDAAAADHVIVPVSQDLEGAAKVAPFFAEHKFARLKSYLDSKADLSIAYGASLPTSILYDSTGKEVWRMTGGMDWTSGTAKQLLAEAT